MINYKKSRSKNKKYVENIKDFPESKKLYLLSKPHSWFSIAFIEHNEDPWFIFVKYYKTKTGEITDSSIIIRKDLDIWLKSIKNLGYVEIKR